MKAVYDFTGESRPTEYQDCEEYDRINLGVWEQIANIIVRLGNRSHESSVGPGKCPQPAKHTCSYTDFCGLCSSLVNAPSHNRIVPCVVFTL